MTARTRKATTPSTAKKTTAAKKPTAPRTRKATTEKKTTPPAAPRLSLVKPAGLRTAREGRRLPWMTDTQGFATYAARLVGIPTRRIRDWRDHRDGTATRPLVDGSLLHYTLATRTLAWHALCPQGAIHVYTLTSPSVAAAARVHADRCTTTHADLDHIPALTADELATYGIHTSPTLIRPDVLGETPTESIPVLTKPAPTPEPAPRTLADQLTRSGADTTATQPMNTREIAAGLTTRTDNDLDTAKEHPDHA